MKLLVIAGLLILVSMTTLVLSGVMFDTLVRAYGMWVLLYLSGIGLLGFVLAMVIGYIIGL